MECSFILDPKQCEEFPVSSDQCLPVSARQCLARVAQTGCASSESGCVLMIYVTINTVEQWFSSPPFGALYQICCVSD